MFGLGFPEIIFILIVATIILGPEHMPRAARAIGRWSAKLRSAATSFETALTEDEDFREVKNDLHEIKSELKAARNEMVSARNEVTDVSEETHQAFQKAREELTLFQAKTGRDAGTDAESEAKLDQVPEPSPFMSQPLGKISASVDEGRDGQKSVRLSFPKLLSGEISRQVSRRRVELQVPACPATKHRSVAVAAVCPSMPFCRIRVLPKAGKTSFGDLRKVRLALPANNK